MRLRHFKFTVQRLMVAVGICAFLLWIAPICVHYCWTWMVVRDVKRGQSTRYSAQGYATAGPLAVQALREAIKSDQKNTRLAALQSLGMIAHDPNPAVRKLVPPAVPDLIDALRHDDDDVRIWAAIALGRIGSDAATAVEPLIELVRDDQRPVVIPSAIQALGDLGPVANAALPLLTSMVNDPQHVNHTMAIRAFWKIGPKGPAETSIVVPKLMDARSKSKDPRESAWIDRFLSEISPAAPKPISDPSTAAEDPELEDRHAPALD